MNIAKFNKLLSLLVNKATIAENDKKIKDAIDTWIEITELTIKTSKSPELEFTFRNMLYNRTEGIIDHIKELKNKLKYPKKKPISIHPPKVEENRIVKDNSSKILITKEKDIKKELDDKNKAFISQEKKFKAIQKDFEIIKNSEFKNLPKNVKEIKAQEDFTILTPHDPDYVEKRLKQSIEMSVFNQNNSNIKNEGIKLDEVNEEGKLICFACGKENPPNSKKCKDCGTEF